MRRMIACLLGLAAGVAATAQAAPVPATIELSALRAVQDYNLDRDKHDQVYVMLDGVAAGQKVAARFPEKGTWEAAPKVYPVSPLKDPQVLWKGALDDGQFAFVTVTLIQTNPEGKSDEALKAFKEKMAAADEKLPQLKEAKIDAAGATKLSTDALAAHQEVIKGIKDIFSREKKTDHFGGQFTLLVRNEGGKLVKRLDPVGLTFGEHYGTDVKIYTKIKFTRANVFTQDKSGAWAQEMLTPIPEDGDPNLVRVKMLETEYVGAAPDLLRNVTDYVLDIQVRADDQLLNWSLGGEEVGKSDLHTYYMYAE